MAAGSLAFPFDQQQQRPCLCTLDDTQCFVNSTSHCAVVISFFSCAVRKDLEISQPTDDLHVYYILRTHTHETNVTLRLFTRLISRVQQPSFVFIFFFFFVTKQDVYKEFFFLICQYN